MPCVSDVHLDAPFDQREFGHDETESLREEEQRPSGGQNAHLQLNRKKNWFSKKMAGEEKMVNFFHKVFFIALLCAFLFSGILEERL